MYWGSVSDRIGRKKVIIYGCLGTLTSLLLVGLAPNFWVALAGRFIGGALNGNIGEMSKTTSIFDMLINLFCYQV